jgi:hypothetical protein
MDWNSHWQTQHVAFSNVCLPGICVPHYEHHFVDWWYIKYHPWTGGRSTFLLFVLAVSIDNFRHLLINELVEKFQSRNRNK